MPGFNIIVIILRWRNNSDNLKTILKWMSAISSMESYPVGKESLSSGQGPLTLRKKVLGARDRGATATERHAQQEWRTPLPKITELASYMAEASRFRSSCCFPSSNATRHSHGITSDRPRLSGTPRKEMFWGASAMPLPLPPEIFWIAEILRGNWARLWLWGFLA